MTAQPQRASSYGRGGAGNISKESTPPPPTVADLVTPTLKSEHYTTGRGGTGNMARNDPNFPEIARKSQDVEAPPHREPEGPHHYGRGGAANVAKPTEEEKKREEEKKAQEAKKREEDASAGKALVDKVKEGLKGFGKK